MDISFESVSDRFYYKTGKKIHWYMGSCCLEISSFSQNKDFSDFYSATNIEDAEVVIIGTKIGPQDIKLFKSVSNLHEKDIILFGNCVISGGIFNNQIEINSFFKNSVKCQKVIDIPGCPPSLIDLVSILNLHYKEF